MLLFILKFIPSWIFLVLLGMGVSGYLVTYFLKLVPIPYKMAIQIGSIALIIFSTFMYGGSYNNDAWMVKVNEMQAKVDIAEAKVEEANIQLQTNFVERTRVIREKGDDIIRYIDREVVKKEEIIRFVENCPIPKEIIDLHNQAALQE